jgi:hypothetical protein
MRKVLFVIAMIVCLGIGYFGGVMHTKLRLVRALADVFNPVSEEAEQAPGKTAETSMATEARSKEELDYLEKVIIRNVEIANAVLGGLGVFGEVKNTGDRTLDEVEITIYFLDKTGKPIFEKKYYPVLVSEMSVDNEPLKPGYARKFGVTADDAPSDWARKVEVKITGVQFTQPADG